MFVPHTKKDHYVTGSFLMVNVLFNFRFSLAITVGKVVARIVKKDFGGEGKEVWLFISKSGTLPYDTVYISTVTT